MRRHARVGLAVVVTLALVAPASAVDLTQFRLLGQYSTGGYATGTLAVEGNIVYLPYPLITEAEPERHRLDILDVSNPAAIVRLGRLEFDVPRPREFYSAPIALIVHGGLLYMSLHTGGFAIIDVSDLTHPWLVSQWAPPSPGYGDAMQGLLLDGSTLYVGWDWNHGLGVFDVSNPTAPVELAETGHLGGYARDVAKRDHYVFVTTYYGNAIRVFDVANPGQPVQVSSLSTPGSAYWIGEIGGEHLFVPDARDQFGLKVFDIADPLDPRLAGQFDTLALGYGDSTNVRLVGSQALVSFLQRPTTPPASPPLHIGSFDVSNPADPLKHDYALRIDGLHGGRFFLSGGRLYIPRLDGYLDIWGAPLLDDFNRTDGTLGANWTGFNDGLHYLIAEQAGQAWFGGPIYWSAGDALAADQHAFVTFSAVDSAQGLDNALLLKVQSDPVPANMSPEPDWIKGCIGVSYNAADESVYVATWRPGFEAWNVYASQPLRLTDGDTFGARALASGAIQVLHNGSQVVTFTLDAADQAFFNGRGGRIGLWFEQAATARFDDFGGGTSTP